MIKFFIGYDVKETVAFHALTQSIIENVSVPVQIIPLNNEMLREVNLRPIDKRQSNAFSFTRFLVPYLCDYHGTAIYMDCDMVLTNDVVDLVEKANQTELAVHVVKHDYESSVQFKYLGNKQYTYPRKNWSSFVVWNCGHCKNQCLTPDYIAKVDAAHLHRFLWLDDSDIGSLDVSWNFLVGEYTKAEVLPSVLHWTLGGPYFNEYRDADYAELWFDFLSKAMSCHQLDSSS